MALDGPSDVEPPRRVPAPDQRGGLGRRELRYVLGGIGVAGARAPGTVVAGGAPAAAAAAAQLGQGGGPPAVGRGGKGPVGGCAEEKADVGRPEAAHCGAT